ncbi:MAG: 30S ribosomal protein S20 [Candidatus Paceibacterota bacterium]|nr:MAG: 30S ribosomal protein S20 [Candidatus Paceibacterota bacterium]
MPITSSAKKALRSSKKKRVFNLRRKDAMSSAIKKIKKLTADQKLDEAKGILPEVYKAIDKAAKRGVISKEKASRKKSQMASLIKN